MLLNAGADIFAADKKNRTPRDLLPYEPKSQVYHSLFVHGNNNKYITDRIHDKAVCCLS